jgi:hypothetical protein
VVVIGTPVETGSVAWESPGDGSTFLSGGQGLQNGGMYISPVSLFYTFDNAVALSNTDVALLDDYGDYFSDSPFAGPESPAIPASNSNQGNGGLYPRKSQSTEGPEIAAEPAPAPAPAGTDIVVGVADNYAGPNTTLPGCANSSRTGYGVSVATVNGASKAAGTLNGEGIPGYGLLTCSAENPVLASPVVGTGGTVAAGAGIGVLENEGNGISGAGTAYTLNYKPFDSTATGGTFPSGPGTLVANLTSPAGDIDLSDDSGTGVYALWSSNGLHMAYSTNGGATWFPPVLIPQPSVGEIANPVITGVGDGAFLLGYTNDPGTGTETFLQLLSYQELLPETPVTVTTSQTDGSTQGPDISIPVGSVGETDTARLTGTDVTGAAGTVTYTLYSTSTCTAASAQLHSTAAVTGGIVGPSAPITTMLGVGKYYWQAVYSGNTATLTSPLGNEPAASTCGSEILTIGPASTIASSATSTSSTVTVSITCAVTPCTVTLTITIPAAGSASDGADAAKAKTVTLGTGKFTIRKKGPAKLTVKLSKKGKRYVKTHHGTRKATLLVRQKIDGHTVSTSRLIKIKHSNKKK